MVNIINKTIIVIFIIVRDASGLEMTSMTTNPNHIEMVESVRVRSKKYDFQF